MNLFQLDLDAKKCAECHQDAHLRVCPKEAVQALCAAFPVPHETVRVAWTACRPLGRLAADLLPYGRTKSQENHPIALWVRATSGNFDRTIELAEALMAEYRYRFGKPHGSEVALDWVRRHRAEAQVPIGPLQPCALVMPEEYVPGNGLHLWLGAAVAAYRAYYRAEKRGYWRQPSDPTKPSIWVPAKWTRRDPPEWF